LLAALALLSLESVSLSLFTQGVFSRTRRPIPPAAAHFDLQISGELMSRPEGFLTAKENAGVSPRGVIVVRHFSTMVLAPKVPRYISKSVLNI
jgi:hypothetical protein